MYIKRNFKSSNNSSNNTTMQKEDDRYERSELARKIVNLVYEINKINSFDSSTWNLSRATATELERKKLEELKNIASSLNYRLLQLQRQNEKSSPRREQLEASKWTGKKPEHLTDKEFDRFQRD